MFPSPFLDVWTKISFDNFSLPLVLSSLIMMCLGVLWVYPFYFRSFKSLIFIDLLSCLENPRAGGSLVGCCLWGRTESDTTEAT